MKNRPNLPSNFIKMSQVGYVLVTNRLTFLKLVANYENLGALAPVSGAISCPDKLILFS